MKRISCRALALSLCLAVAPIAIALRDVDEFQRPLVDAVGAGLGSERRAAGRHDVPDVLRLRPRRPAGVVHGAARRPGRADRTARRCSPATCSSRAGSYFGGPYFTSDFAKTSQVGTATFRGTSTTAATLTYVVGNGVVVGKEIERLPLRTRQLHRQLRRRDVGHHVACALASNNGIRSEESGTFTIAHVGTVMEIRSPGCTYTGSHSAARAGEPVRPASTRARTARSERSRSSTCASSRAASAAAIPATGRTAILREHRAGAK